jgi:hypothetical protein
MKPPNNLREMFSIDYKEENRFYQSEGFPEVPAIKSLENAAKESPVYIERRKRLNDRTYVPLSFNPKGVLQRQDFFRKIWNSGYDVDPDIFKEYDQLTREEVKAEKLDYIHASELALHIISSLRLQLSNLQDIPEAKRITDKLKNYETEFTQMKELALKSPSIRFVLLDTEKNVAIPLTEVDSKILPDRSIVSTLYNSRFEGQFGEITENMKGAIAKSTQTFLSEVEDKLGDICEESSKEFEGKLDYALKKGLRSMIATEFYRYGGSIRGDYEYLAVPFRIRNRYKRFLSNCERHNRDMIVGQFDLEGEERSEWRDFLPKDAKSKKELGIVPDPMFPRFSNHYDLKELIPPTFMETSSKVEDCVPITFKTKPGEKKFFLNGLNRGGKSAFLEALYSVQIPSQVGLPVVALKAEMPLYRKLYYFKSRDEKGKGRLKNEIDWIKEVAAKARENDLVIGDELLGSADSEVIEDIGALVFERLDSCEATIMLESHGFRNYDLLEGYGWVNLSPDWTEEDSQIKPAFTLSRGRPDREILKRYAKQMFNETWRT